MHHQPYAICHKATLRAARGALLAIVLAVSSCTAPKMDAVQRQRWALAWVGALNSRQWEQIGGLLGPASTFTDPLAPARLDRVWTANYLQGLWVRFPKLRYDVKSVAGDDSVVVVEWTASGIPQLPSGLAGVSVLRVEGNGLAEVRNYYNTTEIAVSALLRR